MSLHSSKACCTLPPAVSENYELKGSYSQIASTKTYVTGRSDATKAVVFLYDIFGFSPQTLQGADIVASAGYRVFVPDFFYGNYAKGAWFAPEPSKQDDQDKATFFNTAFDFNTHISNLEKVLAATKSEAPTAKEWAAVGFCWGGKMVALTSGSDPLWNAAVQTSPAKVDPEDAKKITIPQMMLASKDEPVDDVKGFEANLGVDHHVEIFDTMVHAFMSTRANLKDAEQKAEYERGYQLTVDFLNKHLS